MNGAIVDKVGSMGDRFGTIDGEMVCLGARDDLETRVFGVEEFAAGLEGFCDNALGEGVSAGEEAAEDCFCHVASADECES